MNAHESAPHVTHDSGELLQRSCGCGGSCGDCSKKKEVQRSALQNASTPKHAPQDVHDVLRTSGQPLDASARADMEPRFGHDLSRVRVHHDGAAQQSAAAVRAEAYTVGQHIVFGQGRYAPSSHEGRSLLAHELAHTVQQRNAQHRDGEPLAISTPGDAGETEAHGMADSAAAARSPGEVAESGPQVARADRKFLLTFDDGPHAAGLGKGTNRTENVLNTLCTKNIKASFFVQTAAIDAEGHAHRGSTSNGKALIKRMSEDGHNVAIHTGGKKDHELHTDIPSKRLQKELGDAKTAIKDITGKTPTQVRPPTGAVDARVEKDYAAVGLTNVLWDIDGDKGEEMGKSDLEARVKSGIKSMVAKKWVGSTAVGKDTTVVLYHDIKKGSSSNLPGLIDLIKSETASQTKSADKAVFPAASCKAKAKDAGAEGKAPSKPPVVAPPKDKAEPPAKEPDKPTPAPPAEKKVPSDLPISTLDDLDEEDNLA